MHTRIAEALDEVTTPSKREEIQWPALDRLTPTNLRRTMSSVMKEWEKSLTPPAGNDQDPITDLNDSTESTHEALMLSR
jgi:hypothetical protein